MMPTNPVLKVVCCLLVLGLFSCSKQPKSKEETAQKLRIVATTGMIADALRQIAGEHAQVEALMGPGVDPHLYKATHSDLQKIRDADVVFYNGLHLEGKMDEALKALAEKKAVYALGEKLDPGRLISIGPHLHDPHIWFDVTLWRDAIAGAGEKLIELDPKHASVYRKRMESYLIELEELDNWVRDCLQSIPKSQRVLISAHDAFTYFGRAYEIEVKGLQGISTLSEVGLRDIKELVDVITDRQIKAVFIESSVPAKALEAVVSGCKERKHDVEIGGTLFSDAMGAAGTPEGSYLGMVRHNVNTLIQALK